MTTIGWVLAACQHSNRIVTFGQHDPRAVEDTQVDRKVSPSMLQNTVEQHLAEITQTHSEMNITDFLNDFKIHIWPGNSAVVPCHKDTGHFILGITYTNTK